MTGERAFVYAKACGIIGKSFVGKRIRALSGLTRLSELDRLLFPDSGRELPERELLPDLEGRIIERSIHQILSVIGSFGKPPELLVLMLRSYEYADLKSVLSALSNKEPKPRITDIGRFRTVNFDVYPSLKDMLKNTEFSFLIKKEDSLNSDEMKAEIDRRYYMELYNALSRLSPTDRAGIGKIIDDEIRLRNISWVLRLRTYYQMNTDKIAEMLISIDRKKDLTQDALDSFAFPLDNKTDWMQWKWAKFVNEESSSSFWSIDPRYFQNKVSRYLYKRAYACFHTNPFSLLPVFCFVRLKQFEEDLLTSTAEGFGFGLSSRETLGLLEVA